MLRARDAELLSALLSGSTMAEAIKATGLSKSAAYRIRGKQSFQTALQKARSELLESTIDRLRSISRAAVDTLSEIATDAPRNVSAPRQRSERSTPEAPTIPASARVSAAREALAALFKGVETFELERRLAALEAQSNTATPTWAQKAQEPESQGKS
jgi:hypothetical protein